MSNSTGFLPLGSAVPAGRELERVADIDARLTRTHYFDGRLLTAEDLIRDQVYLDQRLREVGQTLGSGVVRGLEVSLSAGMLDVSPGLAVSSAGRVLQLDRRLSLHLDDRALIARLNAGRHGRLERGLYAVTLHYAEVRTDVAEVFPRDLGARAEVQHDRVNEGVQLALTPLPQPLPQQSQLHLRALLMREYLGGAAAGVVPEDAVALGVLAVAGDRPLWLDGELLRQPLRPPHAPNALQSDLARLYEALLRDVLRERRITSPGAEFAADQYFKLLPPVGSLPKAAIDPSAGRQSYFPESFQVWVAPVRVSDLELVRQESLRLEPIDLGHDQAVDIIVLAPLANRDYGRFARALERSPADAARLPFTDPLMLRIYPMRPVHELDTDRVTWEAIWDRVGDDRLIYVRRPLRVAETALSGIVLAQGTAPPPEPDDGQSPADGVRLLRDEDSILLNRINLGWLASLRPPGGRAAETALRALIHDHGDDAVTIQAMLAILLRVERRYDGVIWQTLRQLADDGRVPAFRERLVEAQASGETTADAVARLAGEFGFGAALVRSWRAVEA
ncbi:hypothetical protein TVNIR_2134 [Thioalkalivibrio nitratireducens DSM 14787]|uniref:Uncharacterized protein n=1 Tax=Thioalkalivibrio nitratireducens (strain DSM 14787 / UNIQEM 213 / ALEN2) TaxID=1255043 RepID=L0DXU1_THIND|nr:hypothetical protein [Thioalkalivibrio nitratireducens]AGA33790.1 hypothetical protein TVNIR_2134 [Thioalkalivibrio nitratireducens DSM 14787]